MTSNGPDKNKVDKSTDHRDFPRLHVEAKVRIAESAVEGENEDQPAVISDLSLGGARLSTPATLKKDTVIGLIPFTGLLPDHPLHKVLEFRVMWRKAPNPEADTDWCEYGLLHQGSVLDVLNSWLGHLLLRRKGESEISTQRRRHRRFHLNESENNEMKARLSHDSRLFNLTLLDIATGGLLARSQSDVIPIGVHLEMQTGWDDEGSDMSTLLGCVVDAHSHSGSTFYRVAFDPDSELDDDHLVNWAERVGGELEY